MMTQRRSRRASDAERLAKLEEELAYATEQARLLDSFSGAVLRAHRRGLGLSAQEYASLVGCTPATIYNWEAERSTPQGRMLKALQAVSRLTKEAAWERLRKGK